MHPPDIQSARMDRYFEYRPAVDGLRGVAVLAVLGFHAFAEYVPGGFVGVDVFFVISGYLITGIIARHLQVGVFSFIEFYARRVRRLFPALVLVLLVSVALGWLILLPDEFRLLGKHVTAAAMFAANIAFWREAGYFDISAEFKPLLHLWSLGVEEQFYLVWPILLVALWKYRTLLLTVLCASIVISLALSVTWASTEPNAGFYLPFSRFWELGAGCLLALIQQRTLNHRSNRRPSSPRPDAPARRLLLNIMPVAGLALIGASLFVLDHHSPFPGWRALLPVVGTLLVIATPEEGWIQRRVLGGPVLVYVGLISYTLYLWHWPLLAFANILQAGVPPAAVRWAILLASAVLAALTYHLVELPVRRRKQFSVNMSLGAGAAVAGCCGLAVYIAAGIPQRFDVDLQPLRHGARIDEVCRAEIDSDRINYCRTTAALAPDILVLGDSRAQAVYEAIAPRFAPEYTVMLLGRGGCPPLLDVEIRGYDLNEADCPEIWRTFVSYARSVQPQVIVLVGNGSFLLTRPEIELERIGSNGLESKPLVFSRGLHSLLAELNQGTFVVHVGEIPGFRTSPTCLLRPLRLPSTQCEPTRERVHVESSMSKYNEILAHLHSMLPGILFVDAVEILCTKNECSQWPRGGPLLYSDEVHLSATGSQLLVDKAGIERPIAQYLQTSRTREASRGLAEKAAGASPASMGLTGSLP